MLLVSAVSSCLSFDLHSALLNVSDPPKFQTFPGDNCTPKPQIKETNTKLRWPACIPFWPVQLFLI